MVVVGGGVHNFGYHADVVLLILVILVIVTILVTLIVFEIL